MSVLELQPCNPYSCRPYGTRVGSFRKPKRLSHHGCNVADVEDQCEIDGCDRPRYQGRQMCGSHFMKWYRHGDPHYRQQHTHADITGQRFGSLTARQRTPAGQWICDCDCGNETTVRIGDLNRGGAKSCGIDRNHWIPAGTYRLAHSRVTSLYGPAKRHRCVDCGNQAKHWSYNHQDPAALLDTKYGPFSPSPDYYEPRCVPCHKRFDLARVR